jgi:dihydrofolate reductase
LHGTRHRSHPGCGAWDLDWKGWWGDKPPYHKPTFVLTHHERADLPMAGGTTLHFITGGIHDAFKRAQEVAALRRSTSSWWTS